jgi:hypothetical protein
MCLNHCTQCFTMATDFCSNFSKLSSALHFMYIIRHSPYLLVIPRCSRDITLTYMTA